MFAEFLLTLGLRKFPPNEDLCSLPPYDETLGLRKFPPNEDLCCLPPYDDELGNS